MTRTTALVLAAGQGSRMGMTRPKVLAELAGRTILEWSVDAFLSTESVDGVVVVAPAEHTSEVAGILKRGGLEATVTAGGATRSASTAAGLAQIAHDEGFVIVHDGARPLVTTETIEAVLDALVDNRAVTVAAPATDTILVVSDDRVLDIPERSWLWHAQTPQGFHVDILRRAYRAAGTADFSDDTSIVRRYLPDVPIAVVPGQADNIKITRPGDIEVAESLLAARGARMRPYSE